MKEPDEEYKLNPRERCQIKTGRIHQLGNLDTSEAIDLLVQGIGQYDFKIVKD